MKIQLSHGIIVNQITADCAGGFNIADYITPIELSLKMAVPVQAGKECGVPFERHLLLGKHLTDFL